MKVVLFCGGRGLRLREYSGAIPKPMVTVGYRPILWHVMRYFAHFGHREFVLCLGYKADVIKDYFLRYNEALSNDFVLSNGGRDVELLQRDIQDWRISFIDTGLQANIGQRLRAVRRFVDDAPFLANYGDVLTDAPLDDRVDRFLAGDDIGSFLCVRPSTYTFHLVRLNSDRHVKGIEDIGQSELWINGGYFIFRPELFDYLGAGEELIEEPFARLIEAGRLRGDPYEGFWAPMDTLKDLQLLESAYEAGRPPWAVWSNGSDEEA